MREIIRRLAIEPSINWIECQSRKDALNFWEFEPVAGIGIQLGPERCNPLVWQVRFRDMLSPQFYRELRWKLFRLHFQYIMANHMRAPYDFFMLIGSPVPIMEWAKRQRAVIHAVVVGIIMLIRKGLVDAASVSSDPLSCLRNRREEASMRWLYLAVIIVFATATLLFILQNGDLVTMSFLGLSFRAPFAILIAIAYVLGAATGGSLFALLRRSYQGSQRLPS